MILSLFRGFIEVLVYAERGVLVQGGRDASFGRYWSFWEGWVQEGGIASSSAAFLDSCWS